MQSTILPTLFLLLLISKTTKTQSPDDENKLYSKFLSLNSSHTHSHMIAWSFLPDQVFWWTVIDETKLSIAVTGPGSDYVAVGFSPDGGMVGSVAVIALNSVPPQVGVYFLGGQEQNQVTRIPSSNIVGPTILTYLDGTLVLEFVWDTKGSNGYYNFSISDNVNMVWSWRDGPIVLDYHVGRTQSLSPLNFQTGAGAVTYTTPKCGTGIPGNTNGYIFQDPCVCRGFYQPPDCVKTNLTNSHSFLDSGNDNIVSLNWRVVKGVGYFDVLGSSNGWIGVGFCTSREGLMLNMEPVIGWVDRDTGKGNVVVRYVQSGSTLSPNNRLNISDVSAWIIDGQMGMHFSRNLSAGYNPIVNGNAFMVASKNINDRPLPIIKHTAHSNGGVVINLINGTVSILQNDPWWTDVTQW